MYSHDVSVGGTYIALYTYLYKKPMGKKCHHHKLTMKPRVIGIGKEMIEIEKSTKERLHIM